METLPSIRLPVLSSRKCCGRKADRDKFPEEGGYSAPLCGGLRRVGDDAEASWEVSASDVIGAAATSSILKT